MGHLGGARPGAALHALQSDGVGGVRPRGRTIERFGARARSIAGDGLRDEIHEQVCARGLERAQSAFTQSYGSQELDASVLLIRSVGFLPPTDERVVVTVEAVQRWLTRMAS